MSCLDLKTEGKRRTPRRRSREKVEAVLGHPLKPENEVHHVDGNPMNTENKNLVACEAEWYHQLLHVRAKALKECGHVDWRKCCHCQKYSDPKEMVECFNGNGNIYYRHQECINAYARSRKEQRTAYAQEYTKRPEIHKALTEYRLKYARIHKGTKERQERWRKYYKDLETSLTNLT